MAVFKITDNIGAALRGGASRAEGLAKLDALDKQQSQRLLEGLRTNLAGADGLSKHGVLKLRNSSSTGSGMEFARMNGMDRWFSKESTFANTSKALRALLINSGTKPETADALLKQYGAKDGSIKCKDAITLINRVLPQSATGSTLAESLRNAGIHAPAEAMQDSIQLEKQDDLSQGGFGKVFPATDNGSPCIVKRFGVPREIKLDKSGNLTRGDEMDANHLAAGKVPGTIAPNRYIISKLEPDGSKSFHTVTAGRNFKEFCRLNKGSVPELDDKGNPRLDDEDNAIERSILELHGIVMDKAKGARMDQVRSSESEQKEIAQGFASILMNASSRGVVFYDIKRQNAFVDGGKITLIDTDGAFKNSKTQSKNPEKPTVAATYIVPTKNTMNANSPHRGMQQDLWCVGISLLEHAGRGNGNLDDVGLLQRQDAYNFWTKNNTVEEQFVWLKNKIGVPEPRPGSVEDFALLCIKTALSKHDAPYFKRFTGEGKHLLDPILAHPLIGGREAFIDKNLVKSEPGQIQENLLNQQNIKEEVDSIDESEPGDEGYSKTQIPFNYVVKNEIVDSDEEDGDDKSVKSNNPEDFSAFMQKFVTGAFNNEPRTRKRSSSESEE
jgi:hypothetical protein